MANDCAFTMMAVSPEKASLEKLVDILRYEDPDWYIYRVRDQDADKKNIMQAEDGLCSLQLYGDVAWGCSSWVNPIPPEERTKAENGAVYTNLPELSERLNIAFEVIAEECGMAFGEYIHVSNGKVIASDTCDYEEWLIEDESDLENLYELAHDHLDELDESTKQQLASAVWELRRQLAGETDEYCGFNVRYGGYGWTHHSIYEVWATVPLDHEVGGLVLDV